MFSHLDHLQKNNHLTISFTQLRVTYDKHLVKVVKQSLSAFKIMVLKKRLKLSTYRLQGDCTIIVLLQRISSF